LNNLNANNAVQCGRHIKNILNEYYPCNAQVLRTF